MVDSEVTYVRDRLITEHDIFMEKEEVKRWKKDVVSFFLCPHCDDQFLYWRRYNWVMRLLIWLDRTKEWHLFCAKCGYRRYIRRKP